MDIPKLITILSAGKEADNYEYEGILLEDEVKSECVAHLHHGCI